MTILYLPTAFRVAIKAVNDLEVTPSSCLALQDIAIRAAALPRARSDASQEAATLELLLVHFSRWLGSCGLDFECSMHGN